VVVTNAKLLAQFGGGDFDLNRATYTRYHFTSPPIGPEGPIEQPDAILVLIPGFEGGAGGFQILAENLLPRALAETGQLLEVWAFDRRSHQLEDLAGLDLAEQALDPQLALDWLFGEELGLPLSQELSRRAVFYDPQGDVPFLAQWTPLVHSLDVDAVVEAARAAARSGNVFLGGHSAGTGFAARYAATDFDLAGAGPAEPGYAKLRGLVLLEGGGGSSASSTPPDEDALDLIEARFDGGLFGAVRDGEARCVDGTTPCAPATEDVDCAAFENEQCVATTTAYALASGLLSPRLLAAAEPVAIQAAIAPDDDLAILQREQNAVPDNSAIAAVPDLNILGVLRRSTAHGLIGLFVDDEGFAASTAQFIAMSVGALGPERNGLGTWLERSESAAFPPCPGAGCVTPDNGPPPTALPAGVWGVERESIELPRLLETLYRGGTNFTDWYYPSSGLSVTQGLPGLDTSALSADPPVGRGRRDIDNVVLAAGIDVPVIGFGGSNGLTPVPASFLAFAESIGPCAAPSCDGATPRVVSATTPNEAFPTFGGSAGGYEVHISEGYSHVDPLAAEDGLGNEVVAPLAAFLFRNSE
jgi:pimeloyl-ACP methyl ester carboxylesterase